MRITFDIPDEVAAILAPPGRDLSRAALEAVALEGYRCDRLTEADIRRILGFETRIEVHAFLKEHGAFLAYTVQDLEHDREVAREVAQRARILQRDEPAHEHRAR